MFQQLLNLSLNNRLLVILAAMLVAAYGAFSLQRTPVDVFPDLNKPTVTLMTEAGGMAAQEVEQLITFPLETALNGLPDVEVVRSVSSSGLSFIYVTFGWQTDIYLARQMVAERLASIETNLPPGLTTHMGPISSVMGEIMQIAIPVKATGLSPMAVREYADWVLRPRLLAIQGVAQVIPIGGEVRQYQVQPKLASMVELGITIDNLQEALSGFATNTAGGFLSLNGTEYLIRHLGRTTSLNDLGNLVVGQSASMPVLLKQVANVAFAPAVKRGDAGLNGEPAVILGIQKQPTADTIDLTNRIEQALALLSNTLPVGMAPPKVTFRQASFIEASINTLEGKLLGASVVVALVLLFFLGSLRPTLIALTAIPVSILCTVLVFRYFGLSINTMTLGGLAIAIGGLVDDAVVDVENILRRLRLQRQQYQSQPFSLLSLVAKASMEVRSGIVYATAIIVLVFLPLFALPGIEGKLFMPLGIAFIVSTLASLVVSVTLTPVLAYYLLPAIVAKSHEETRLINAMKARYKPALTWALSHGKPLLLTTGLLVVMAVISLPFFAKTFLPPFNEGSYLVGLRLNPGVTLEQSSALARQAEVLLQSVPEITHVGRRSGRAELDEHAEGVHASELDIGLIPVKDINRPMSSILSDIRQQLAHLPAAIAIGQPISHRLDHMLSGVRTQIAIKLFGEDLDTLRATAGLIKDQLSAIDGLVDLQIEKQVLAPEIQIRVNYEAASRYGVPATTILRSLQAMVEGSQVAQVVDGEKRFALVIKLDEPNRSFEQLQNLLIPTASGPIPLSKLANVTEGDGPNQISREDGKRRIVLSANTQDRALSEVINDINTAINRMTLPSGYYVVLGGQFEAQREATKLVGLLSIVSLTLMFAVLYSRYQSARLSFIIMGNIPLAMVGAVIGLWLSGQPLSVAALIGFVTLAGISVRNGILKISHYVNLMRFEAQHCDQAMVIRGSLERLNPVLMTALVTAFALTPLLFEAERPGTEILHPVAVVIFSGLISATLLDMFITPLLFLLFGTNDAKALAELSTGDSL